MNISTYTFTITYGKVTGKTCMLIGEFIPYGNSTYESKADTIGVIDMSTWITEQIVKAEKNRPSPYKQPLGWNGLKNLPIRIIGNNVKKKVQKAIAMYMQQRYEDCVASKTPLEKLRDSGIMLSIDIPEAGTAKDYTVTPTLETAATLRHIKRLICCSHEVEVDTKQHIKIQSPCVEKRTRVTAVRPNMPQIIVGFTPLDASDATKFKALANLHYAEFAEENYWRTNNVRMMRTLTGWIPEDGNEKRLEDILEATQLDKETLSYILSGLYEGNLDYGDYPLGARCFIRSATSDKSCDTPASNSLKISDTILVGDPCYKVKDAMLECIGDVVPGFWNYYITMSKGMRRPKRLEVRHSSTIGRTLKYRFWKNIGVDSGQCGVYDFALAPLLGTTTEFYDMVTRGTCRPGKVADVFNYRGQGVVSSTCYGDGIYSVRLAKDGDQVVGVRIDFA